MNFALSTPSRARPHGDARRHPLGLMAVVGLHVLVAAALLSARMIHTRPAEPPAVAILPEPVQPPHTVKSTEPPPPLIKPPVIWVDPTREIPIDPEAPHLTTSDRQPPVDDGSHDRRDDGTTQVAGAEPSPRVAPRTGGVNASAIQCRPEYPAAAARAGATGVSHIRFTIAPGGTVTNAQILRASGPTREHRLLDQAAAAALAQCPVTIGTDDRGHPVASTADVEYVWTLD